MNSIEVLLVEDNVYDAELAITSLRDRHLANNIVHVSDGAEALDFIFRKGKYSDREDWNPKLILLDLKMPRVSGLEVLHALKSNDITRTIPVVVLTSSDLDPDIAACYKLGVNSYIIKPVGFDDFVKTVSTLGLYWMLMNKNSSEK